MISRSRLVSTVAAVIAAFALGYVLRGDSGPAAPDDRAGPAAPTTWTCSMHPQIQLPAAGECPICFMDLIPLASEAADGLGPRDLEISPSAVALAGIATAPVERRFPAREVVLVGKVVPDETRQRVITARLAGRLDRLHVNSTGRRVKRGEDLADLYAPDLYRARAELLAARNAVARGEPGSAANLESVRERLRLWDLDPDRVAAGDGRRVTITAPIAGTVIRRDAVEGSYVATGAPLLSIADLDRVWVELQAYERDLAWLAVGQEARFTVDALAGTEFAGEVVFIDPVLDERTRSVRVRLEADNAAGRLRPGMLVRGRVQAVLAADGRPLTDRAGAEAPLVVPATAPLVTGERAVVYVRVAAERPRFTGREVVLGPRADDGYLVRDGLAEGEEVVVHGAFKLDSALQIQARPSMMSPADADDHGHPVAVPDGFLAVAPGLVDAYLALQDALAGDDDTASSSAAAVLLAAVEAAGGAVPQRLAASAGSVAAAAGMAGRRAALQPLSDDLWALLEAAGYAGAVRRFHCPMAFDNRGAHWIQRDADAANPYYGAAMLRCGSEVARLGAGEEGS